MENSRTDTARQLTERKAAALLATLCAALIALGMASSQDSGAAPQPTALGNLAEAQVAEIRDSSGAVVLSGGFHSQVDKLGNTRKEATFSDKQGRTVVGEVEVGIPARSRVNRKPALEAYITGLTPRQTFSIVIDDRVVGSFTTDDHGSIDLRLQDGAMPATLDGTGLSPLMLPSGCGGADSGKPQARQSS